MLFYTSSSGKQTPSPVSHWTYLLEVQPSFPLNRFKITTSLRVLDLLSTNIRPHDAEVADLLQVVQNSSAVVDSLPDHITNVQDTLSALQATHETRLADAKCILPTIPETEPLLG